jgi:hypothetical protein
MCWRHDNMGTLIAKQPSSSVLVRTARVASYVEIESCRWNGTDPKIWPQYTSCNKLKHIPFWLLNTWKHFKSYQYFIFNSTSHHNMHPSQSLCLFLLTDWLAPAQHMDTMTVCGCHSPSSLLHIHTSWPIPQQWRQEAHWLMGFLEVSYILICLLASSFSMYSFGDCVCVWVGVCVCVSSTFAQHLHLFIGSTMKMGKETKRINTWLRELEHDWCLTSPYAFSKPIHWYYSCV